MASPYSIWTELDRAVLYEVAAAWSAINWTYLREALIPPSFELHSGEGTLGRWHPERRTISLSHKLVYEQPWGVVEEVLKHEIAHQYAGEVLGGDDETAHGAAFRVACEKLAIDPAASGLPNTPSMDESEERAIQKIARLLSLA